MKVLACMQGQTEICAATVAAFPKREKWFILLDGQSVTFNGLPRWKLNKVDTQNAENVYDIK